VDAKGRLKGRDISREAKVKGNASNKWGEALLFGACKDGRARPCNSSKNKGGGKKRTGVKCHDRG